MSETNSSYPYASARIKAIEPRLITQDKLGRITESKDVEGAVHVLAEMGYGQPAPAGASFELLIQNELAAADELLTAVSPSDIFTRIMRAPKDYHNLKVLIKLFMQGKDFDSAKLFPGNISTDTLKRAINDNNYYDLPETMKEALRAIDKQFAAAPDVSVVGVYLDVAYSKEAASLVDKMDDPLVSKYFTAFFDISNITAFMRTRAFYGKESFEKAYLEGGAIDRRTFADAFELSDDNALAAVVRGDYARILSGAIEDYHRTKSLYMMEKAKDDYLLSLLKEHRYDMFGIGPLMCYYIAKQREAEAVRAVMTAKQGGIDQKVALRRLKDLL
jgi:V/A-type H+-transporting ATPase subunit C